MYGHCPRTLFLPFVFSLLFLQESHLDAHIGKNEIFQLVEGDAHLHGRLLTIRSGDNGTHLSVEFSVGIGIKSCLYPLAGRHAGNIGFVDVHFDLIRLHVNDGGDAGSRESAASGNRRNHLTQLRVL